MPKNNETNFGKFFNLPNPGLRSYFDIVRKGQDEVYRTTFAKGQEPQKVLKDWSTTLESITDKWPTLVNFENDLRAKVGPMSVMFPLEERMKDIDRYYEDILLPSVPVSDKAIRAVAAEFAQIKGLRVRSIKRTVDVMKKSTNSGSPYFTKRRAVVDKTIPCDVWHERNLQQLAVGTSKQTQWNYCAALGWRGQEGGPKPSDVKQRVVWMFPFAVNILELALYQPLIESSQKFDLVPAWVSMDSVDRRITKLFDTKGADDVVMCTDFSRFDQHFGADMQSAAKAIIDSLLSSGADEKQWLTQIFPIKYDIPLAYDFNKIRVGKHGMGSGSGGTNVDETLAHRALQYEAALSANAKLNPNSQCLGDDGVLSYPGIKAEDVMRSYTAHGLEMNESKQYVSTQDCVYLRRWHHVDYRVDGICVGVYSTYRALGRLMEQERYYDSDVWSATMVALRQLSIIENVKYHPLREKFADFCMERDKYRLGIDIPGFLDNISSIAKEATELMPDFLGYTKSLGKDSESGLDSWWIVNYLKSR